MGSLAPYQPYKIVLVDEPTIALGQKSGRDMGVTMPDRGSQQGCIILSSTYDNRILDIADRMVYGANGPPIVARRRLSNYGLLTICGLSCGRCNRCAHNQNHRDGRWRKRHCNSSAHLFQRPCWCQLRTGKSHRRISFGSRSS
jgi:energy-coupling factor transporter ATP-binding protein EcfA2